MHDQEIDRCLAACVKKRAPPGCVCWIGTTTQTIFHKAYGYSQVTPTTQKLTKNTVFDIASITKPICTAMSIMLLGEQKQLRIHDQIKKYLPGIKGMPNSTVTIRELLTHTSGLPAWFPLYLLPRNRRLSFLGKTTTGEKNVTYSCLGYILLGLIVETVSGMKIDEFFASQIVRTSGLLHTTFCPTNTHSIAATELGNMHEKRIAADHGDVTRVRWRTYLIKGEVHDGNAFYAFNGVAGNAGLFSNTTDLATLIRRYQAGTIVRPESVALMTSQQTGGSKEKRGLGWVMQAYPDLVSPAAFSHTGFTGTMLLVDPAVDLIIILLANAVHPRVKPGLMDKARRKVVELAVRDTRNTT